MGLGAGFREVLRRGRIKPRRAEAHLKSARLNRDVRIGGGVEHYSIRRVDISTGGRAYLAGAKYNLPLLFFVSLNCVAISNA